MERHTKQSAHIPKWSALLVEAVNKPGLIMKAYSNFHSYSGRLIDVKFRFDKAKSDAGIKGFRFHDLRHTAATRMADGGADAFAWLRSSDGLTFEWLCATPTRQTRRSAGQLRIWSDPMDQVTNR